MQQSIFLMDGPWACIQNAFIKYLVQILQMEATSCNYVEVRVTSALYIAMHLTLNICRLFGHARLSRLCVEVCLGKKCDRNAFTLHAISVNANSSHTAFYDPPRPRLQQH